MIELAAKAPSIKLKNCLPWKLIGHEIMLSWQTHVLPEQTSGQHILDLWRASLSSVLYGVENSYIRSPASDSVESAYVLKTYHERKGQNHISN